MITDFYRLPNIPINHHNGTATRSTEPQPVNILVTGPSAWELCRVWRGTPVFRGSIRRRGLASHTLPSPLLSTADYTITGKRGARVPSLPDVWCRTSLIILPPNQVDRDPAPPAIIPPRLALPGTTRNTRQHCPSVQPPAYDASTISEISLPSSSNWR